MTQEREPKCSTLQRDAPPKISHSRIIIISVVIIEIVKVVIVVVVVGEYPNFIGKPEGVVLLPDDRVPLGPGRRGDKGFIKIWKIGEGKMKKLNRGAVEKPLIYRTT